MNIELKKNNSPSKNSPLKKLKSYPLKIFRLFSKNLPARHDCCRACRARQPKTYNLETTKGFTLVELLVTISLFVVLTTIVLFSQSKFNGSVLLTNLAYDVALTVRQAQTFGVNVRESSADVFDKAYGVHFDISDPAHFVLFADSFGDDKKYTTGSDSEVNSYSIKRGNKVSDICVTSSGTSDCEINKLDITFLRPEPDAIFESDPAKSGITEAKIIISSANGDKRNVLINSTGQISIGR